MPRFSFSMFSTFQFDYSEALLACVYGVFSLFFIHFYSVILIDMVAKHMVNFVLKMKYGLL